MPVFKPFWILWSLCFSLSVPACSTTPPTTDTLAAYVLQIQVADATFSATLLDIPATEALLDLLPLTLDMQELNGNEKYAVLPQDLPTDAERPGQIQTGDLMLYGSDCLVLFYEDFPTSYSYTPLGKVDDPQGLAQALGAGNVEVHLEIAETA
mgnify:CR=1 FL=1